MTMPVTSNSTRSRATSFTISHFVQLLIMLLIAVAVPVLLWVILPGIAKLFQNDILRYLTYADSFILSILILPAMILGVNYCYMKMLRGENANIEDLFSRLVYGARSILLSLFTGFRTSLWMIPGEIVALHGLAFSSYGYVLQFTAPNLAKFEDGFGNFLQGVGFILAVVLYLIAVIRYCLAMPILADHPDMGVLACFRKSKEIMQGRKLEYVKVIIFYVLILFAVDVILGALLIWAALKLPTFFFYLFGFMMLAATIVGYIFIQVATLLFYLDNGGINATPIAPKRQSLLSRMLQSISLGKSKPATAFQQYPGMPNQMPPQPPMQNPASPYSYSAPQAPVPYTPVPQAPVPQAPVPQAPVSPAPVPQTTGTQPPVSTRRAHRRSQEDWQNPNQNTGPMPGQPAWPNPAQNPSQPAGQPSWYPTGQIPQQNGNQNPPSFNNW